MSVQRSSCNDSIKIMNTLITKKRRCSESTPSKLVKVEYSNEPISSNSETLLEENDTDNDGLLTDNNDDSENSESDIKSLGEELANWAAVFNISNLALNELLKILRPIASLLPANEVASSEATYTQLTSSYAYPSNLLQLMYDQMLKLNKNVEVLLVENKDLKERLIKLEDENKKDRTRILTEVISQQKLMQGNKPRLLIPPKPFKTIEEVQKFEEDLNKSAEMCEQLEAEIFNYNIPEPSKFVRTIWRKIFTDEIATKYSWKGTNTKKSVLSMVIATVLRSAFNRKFSVDEKYFASTSSKWFQTANDRYKYYNKSK